MHNTDTAGRVSSWKDAVVFEDGNVTVVISTIEGLSNPPYSMRISFEGRHAWFPYSTDNAQLFAARIANLVERAEAWILERQKERAGQIAAEAAIRHERTEHKRKQHEANVERRREENRRRAPSNSKK